MFGIFKKSINLVAPISGKTIDLSQVPDPVFSQKMVGDGLAIETTGSVVVAPCDGEISLVMESNHAFGLTTADGLELLVHVGLDTVTLNGEGFECLVSAGDKVKQGTAILNIDREFIQSKGISLITPVLITNTDSIKAIKPSLNIDVQAGKDVVLEYKK